MTAALAATTAPSAAALLDRPVSVHAFAGKFRVGLSVPLVGTDRNALGVTFPRLGERTVDGRERPYALVYTLPGGHSASLFFRSDIASAVDVQRTLSRYYRHTFTEIATGDAVEVEQIEGSVVMLEVFPVARKRTDTIKFAEKLPASTKIPNGAVFAGTYLDRPVRLLRTNRWLLDLRDERDPSGWQAVSSGGRLDHLMLSAADRLQYTIDMRRMGLR